MIYHLPLPPLFVYSGRSYIKCFFFPQFFSDSLPLSPQTLNLLQNRHQIAIIVPRVHFYSIRLPIFPGLSHPLCGHLSRPGYVGSSRQSLSPGCSIGWPSRSWAGGPWPGPQLGSDFGGGGGGVGRVFPIRSFIHGA